MLKLKKYYKPFILSILIAIVSLFTQAMCDLKLPDYMSDIVNIGIQSNGFEQVAPEAISENGFQLMKTFMTKEDRNYIENNYTKVNQEDIAYVKKYPAVENRNIYVLNKELEDEQIEKISHIFAISSKTMTNVIAKLTEGTEKITQETEESENIDVSKVYEMLPMLNQIPEEILQQARNEANQTPESMLTSVGLIFTQSFYQELGIDLSQIQNQYLIKTGMKMLLICVIGISAAILVGYLGSKIGAGIGRNIRNDVFKKVQSFSSAEFNNFSAASLITRTTNDITRSSKLCCHDGKNASIRTHYGNWFTNYDGTKNHRISLDYRISLRINRSFDCVFV